MIKDFSYSGKQRQKMFPRDKRNCLTEEDAYDLWRNLTQQITDKGYKLGVRAYEPKFDK